MTSVKLYGIPVSTCVWTSRMALHEKGVDYELVPHAPHSPEQLAVHPFGRVPAMDHGAVRLFESSAIVRYVDEVFPGPELQPRDPVARGRMNQWISATMDYVYDAAVRRLIVPRLVVAPRGGPVDEAAIAANLPVLRRNLSIFDSALGESTWLAGDTFSAADLFLAPIVASLSFVPEGAKQLEGLDELNRWSAAVRARPSFGASAPG